MTYSCGFDSQSTGNNEKDSEALSNLINMLFDILKNKIQEKFCKKQNQPPNDSNNVSVNVANNKNLKINIDVSLDDIYNGITKKIVIKIKTKNGYQTIPLYICFIDFKNQYIFQGVGDENDKGERGDVIVNIRIKDNDDYYIDSILDSHDIICKNEIPISLYDYYYPKSIKIKYLGGEDLDITIGGFNGTDKLYTKIENKGLPYFDNEELKRGDLFVYHKLVLPRELEYISTNEFKNILEQYFK